MTFRPGDHLSSAKERKHQGPSSEAFLHLEVENEEMVSDVGINPRGCVVS